MDNHVKMDNMEYGNLDIVTGHIGFTNEPELKISKTQKTIVVRKQYISSFSIRNHVVVTLYSILLLANTLTYSIIHAQIHVTIMQIFAMRTLNNILKTKYKHNNNSQHHTMSTRLFFETNTKNLKGETLGSNTYAKHNHNKYLSTRQDTCR